MTHLNGHPTFALFVALLGAVAGLLVLNTAMINAQSGQTVSDSRRDASEVSGLTEITTSCGSENIALGKVAVASSCQGSGCLPGFAIDGDGDTRWGSRFTENEWIYVDLGSVATVECVVLKWEDAYGKGYTIDTSNDAVTWTLVYTETSGDGNIDTITLTTPVNTRYVRMHGTERGTDFGYSLYEFEIRGSGGVNPTATPIPTSIPGTNIALAKPVYSSFYQDASKAPKCTVDGERTSGENDCRWSSIWEETAWISVDLGAMATITRVAFFWEDAYAADFKIQVSDDGENWTTEYTGTNDFDTCASERVNVIFFAPPVTGRYIRMLGCERCTFDAGQYGYSLYEFEVYGQGDDPSVTPTPAPGPLSGEWTLAWSDEFDGSGSVDANGLDEDNWTIETGVCVNNEQQAYTTSISNVHVTSGTLVIEAHDANPASSECPGCYGSRFTSGRIISRDKQEFEYGRVEARIKLPVGEGLWPAFWLLGANFGNVNEVGQSQCGVASTIGWPQCGEIDIMENIGYEHWVSGGIHGPGYWGAGNVGGIYSETAWSISDWHTYTLEWDPVEIKGYMDNIAFYTITRATLEATRGQWVFDHSFFIILNLALGGEYPYAYNHANSPGGGCYGLPQSTIDSLPQRMEVDWVRVYQRNSSGVMIGPDYTQQAHPGQTVIYDHVLTNTGTATDAFSLQVSSTQGWPVELRGETGMLELPLEVGSGLTKSFQVSLTVPFGIVPIPELVTETTIITATSQTSPTVQDMAVNRTIAVPRRIYLPLVVKDWPPVPDLDPIQNLDKDGYYTVTWQAVGPAGTYYVLQEANNSDFIDPTTVYSGTDTYRVASGQAAGTYYYRVRACDGWACGAWSNVEPTSVIVYRYCTTNGQGGTEIITIPPWPTQKIHITMTAKALPDYGYSLWEVEPYGPQTGSVNLALGGDACASSVEDPRWTPDKAIDGDGDTRWASDWDEDISWLEIVLPNRAVVNRIVLRWENAYAIEYCVAMIDSGEGCGQGW